MGKFLKIDFLKTVEASHNSNLVCLLNETMAINQFHRSRLTFDLLAKATHIGVPSIF